LAGDGLLDIDLDALWLRWLGLALNGGEGLEDLLLEMAWHFFFFPMSSLK
jgi:hypothetical protein